jgi:hypothetical protein
LGGEKWLVLVDGGKRRINLMIVIPLKEWKWVGVVLGTWNLKENS